MLSIDLNLINKNLKKGAECGFNATNKSYSNEISLQKKNRPNGCLTDELCEAIKNNDLNLVESLLDAGADLNKNAEALLTAIENNNPEITRLLLEALEPIQIFRMKMDIIRLMQLLT